MSKSYEKQNSENRPRQDVECPDCNDTGMLLERVEEELENGKVIYRDFGRPCHCKEKRALQNRFKNALIPNEFQNARFDNYEQQSEVQKEMFEATKEYLQSFPDIIQGKPEDNSLGFIAVLGETRIRSLDAEARYQAKAEHNNFGLGKTHLQMAAAKWIMNKIKIRDEIAPGQKSKYTRGCRVLCVSDVSFMDDLINAKMMNDEGLTLSKLTNSAINVDVLVWDDLGKAKWSEAKESLYYKIINERYRNQRPIIFSSNEDTGTLSEKIGYAASSRLLGMCGERLYEVEGDDYRLRQGKKVF
ncbi:DNA replication protein DnaC [Salinibacillus kushneri]|uniref:DNA replication protein DnaC n=2 Tax=Salinibacillus kushneri TaxID=237682 RepID=A0A1I0IEF2_9BACI|nr:DNA replication protein DnaC [Salinibacillus kushneri]